MPKTDSLNFASIGMSQDEHYLNLSEKNYAYALNASIEDFNGGIPFIKNTHSNILAIEPPEGYSIVGRLVIPEQERALLFLVNTITGNSEIGEYLNCNYQDRTDTASSLPCTDCNNAANKENIPLEKIVQTPYCNYYQIISANCLNFNIDYPVDIEYRITDCGVNIYFTDDNEERRYLYFDYVDGTPDGHLKVQQHFFTVTGFEDNECAQPIYSNELDCNKIKYNPIYEKPCIDVIDVISGGNLKSGVYQALVAYADVVGNPLVPYTQASNPVPIRTKDITVVTDYITDSAIKFRINNIELSNVFSYYNLVIAQTIENFTEFILVGTFPITTSDFVYTGNNPLAVKLAANEIFFKRPYYRTARTITKSNDYLFFTGLKEYLKYNLQPYAETIKLYWETIAIPEAAYKDPKNTTKFRTYQRDEVYAFALVLEADNGEELCSLHIPAPSKDYFNTYYDIDVDEIVNNNDIITDTSCEPHDRNKLWQVYNIGRVLGTPHEFTENCEMPVTWEYGEFSYWESTEKYPNNPLIWGNLCGKPIRHHKMPDNCITHIHDGKDGNKTYEENNIVYPIGIRIDHLSVKQLLNDALNNNVISQEQFDRIGSYRLVRANRVGNKSVVAKGLLYDLWDYDKFGKKYYYSNYPYNDLRRDIYISNTAATYDTPDSNPAPYANQFRPSGRYTFHSPDTHFTNPRIGSEIKLETLEYGESEGFFNEAQDQAKYKFLSTASYLLALSSGVAAALSSIDKECTTYTTKSATKEIQDKNGFNYVTEGGAAANTLTPGDVVVGTGTSGTSGSINTKMDGKKKDTSIGTIREDYNNAYGDTEFKPYNRTTGSNKAESAVNVESFTKTTCTGSTYQELNNVGILSALTGGTGFGESLQGAFYKISLGLFEMKKILDLIEALVPLKNFALQYNSTGKYNNYKCVPNEIGDKIRPIKRSAYLDPIVQTIDEDIDTLTNKFTTVNVNNLNRESSVYVHIDYDHPSKLLPSPSIIDTSRYVLGEKGSYTDVNKRFDTSISSYYASIKNYVPDQYSNILKLEYLETGACSIPIIDKIINEETIPETKLVFGGDTFINRFALKRKMPFFLQTRFKQLDEADVRYQDLGNVGYPNFYFNSESTLMENIQDLSISKLIGLANPVKLAQFFGVGRNRFDVDTTNSKFFYQDGKIYLYSYGIPYFMVESDVNVDYRHGQNNKEEDFYPHQKNLEDWLQEKNVPITEDNTYFYNTTFSKQNKESYICTNQPDYNPDKLCKSEFPQRLIYSEQNPNSGSSYDNWLIFKANNYNDFPLSNGALVSADGIENDKVLVRFENASSIFAAYDTIQTDANTIQVGTGGIFKSRPREFAVTDLGYSGSQHRSILRTEYGHIWADARRGQVFVLANGGGGLDEVSKNGMKNWFKDNLPFAINKHFPEISKEDIDNNFKGIGLHLSFDKRFSRFFITKLDYARIDTKIKYNTLLKEFFYRSTSNQYIKVELTDTRYFCNKSWTLSYNFLTKSWVSFHSFTPNVYIDWLNYFQSAKNNRIWSHGISNKSYQVYYGKLEPFIIETHSKPDLTYNYLNNIEFSLDTIRYHNEFDSYYNDTINFNKAIVYNTKQCSGLLNLVPTDPEDMSTIGVYPRLVQKGIEIETKNSEGIWSFNDFYDCTTNQYTNLPFFTNNCANSLKELNNKSITYLKDDFNKPLLRNSFHNVMFINDKYSNYSFIFKFANNSQNKSFR